MDPKFQFIWYTFALIFLALEAVQPVPANPYFRWGWVGIFCFVVPAWWTALQAI